jgi:hypothetical protein
LRRQPFLTRHSLLATRYSHASLALFCVIAAPAIAHPIFTAHIEHRINVRIDRRNIDVTVTLTFHELRCMAEKRRMDADHDGHVASGEQQAYLASRADALASAMSLVISDREIALLPLYPPALDFLGVDIIAPAHHELRLSYFARTPSDLAAGLRITIHDALWADAPAILALTAVGEDGYRVTADVDMNVVANAPAAEGYRAVTASCLDAPTPDAAPMTTIAPASASAALQHDTRWSALLVIVLAVAILVGRRWLRRRDRVRNAP